MVASVGHQQDVARLDVSNWDSGEVRAEAGGNDAARVDNHGLTGDNPLHFCPAFASVTSPKSSAGI